MPLLDLVNKRFGEPLRIIQERDARKKSILEEINIPLFEVPYWKNFDSFFLLELENTYKKFLRGENYEQKSEDLRIRRWSSFEPNFA